MPNLFSKEYFDAIAVMKKENLENAEAIKLHCDYGPAVVRKNGVEFWINGNPITDEVMIWMEEQNIPHVSLWTAKERILFKMKFLEEIK